MFNNQKTPDHAEDCYGRQIFPGDIIHYPGRRSSYIWLNFGRVHSVNESTDRRDRKIFTLTIEKIKEHNSEHNWEERSCMSAHSIKKITVYCLDRVLILEGDASDQLEQKFNDAENSESKKVYF